MRRDLHRSDSRGAVRFTAMEVASRRAHKMMAAYQYLKLLDHRGRVIRVIDVQTIQAKRNQEADHIAVLCITSGVRQHSRTARPVNQVEGLGRFYPIVSYISRATTADVFIKRILDRTGVT